MNVAVLGLWHLGPVTAACIAAAGHHVTAWDPDPAVVASLGRGTPPVGEPGLAELVGQQLATGHLRVETDLTEAVRHAEIVWVTFDTPVDDDDNADVESVVSQVIKAAPSVPDGAIVLCSSQLPVGTIGRIEAAYRTSRPAAHISFASAPENLRLGRALEVFTNPDRVVLGTRTASARERLATLFRPLTDRIEWMSVESAEMTKHAINTFLATSIVFINEIASVAEQFGADAREVERGLKSDRRIGPAAYLSPGGGFAGGTLARDINFVRALGSAAGQETPLIDGVLQSNAQHRRWARTRLRQEVGTLAGKRIAVWGLTYKPGTDTLRRSESVELCVWLADQGAFVAVHDPAVAQLSGRLAAICERHQDPIRTAQDADALIVSSEWPIYRDVDRDELARAMATRLVVDANRFLGKTLGGDDRFRLVSVGQPQP
jgi:UDPglucose 6-dehydrogenase